jgi:pyrimidine deaminase RibD-like protein
MHRCKESESLSKTTPPKPLFGCVLSSDEHIIGAFKLRNAIPKALKNRCWFESMWVLCYEDY